MGVKPKRITRIDRKLHKVKNEQKRSKAKMDKERFLKTMRWTVNYRYRIGV